MFSFFKKIFKNRDLDYYDLLDQFYHNYLKTLDEFNYVYPVDLYMSPEESYFVFSADGKVYKNTFKVLDNDKIEVDDYVQVKKSFEEIPSDVRIKRNVDDNTASFVSVSCSSVLNRSGEIDSTELFDSFEENFDENNKPFITYRHIYEEPMYCGQIDEVYRYGNMLITHGTIDLNNPIGSSIVRAVEENPEKWGTSIGFYSQEKRNLEIEDNIKIPVHFKGELIELSFLPEADAASYFTNFRAINKETETMARSKKQLLEQLTKDNFMSEEEAEAYVKDIDTNEATIRENNLITRNNNENEQEQSEEQRVLEIGEEVIQEVRNRISPDIKRIGDVFNNLKNEIEELTKRVNAFEAKEKEKPDAAMQYRATLAVNEEERKVEDSDTKNSQVDWEDMLEVFNIEGEQ